MKNPIRRTKPEKTGLNAPLGDLELSVMRRVWESGAEGVLGGEVHENIEQDRQIALTTVLTTLDRLHDKEIVQRQRVGKAYRYWATVTEEALQQRIVGGVLDRLIAQFPRAVATYFAQQPTADQGSPEKTLSELAQQIESMQNSTDVENDHGH
ncbi:MAG: BlaI/MecI/CopY family transcriptional regulator [Capsulimonas sp.]|uniref:BlaI/MecI/CopY family transcriptional regulator n=1 Tax=Capsulimonas sp. TaxID=2494211 RepID=UPI003265FEA5